MYFEIIRPEDIFRLSAGGILIDVRNPYEYKNGHIPGAVNIPYEELQNHIESLRAFLQTMSAAGKAANIVLYCDRGNVSMLAARDLYRAGFNVKNVCGGLKGYRGPMVTSD